MNHEETCIECGGKIIYTSSGGTCTLCGQPYTIHSTQTGPNAAYNAKVKEIAEILARTPYNPEKWQGIEHFGQMVKERLIEAKMEEARAMVAEMAKEGEIAYDPTVGMLTTTAYLISRGLIPAIPDTKTDDNA